MKYFMTTLEVKVFEKYVFKTLKKCKKLLKLDRLIVDNFK